MERRSGASTAVQDDPGIHPIPWSEVLHRIARAHGGQVSMGSGAQQVALTSGGITRLLDRMIVAGLVRCVPVPHRPRVLWRLP